MITKWEFRATNSSLYTIHDAFERLVTDALYWLTTDEAEDMYLMPVWGSCRLLRWQGDSFLYVGDFLTLDGKTVLMLAELVIDNAVNMNQIDYHKVDEAFMLNHYGLDISLTKFNVNTLSAYHYDNFKRMMIKHPEKIVLYSLNGAIYITPENKKIVKRITGFCVYDVFTIEHQVIKPLTDKGYPVIYDWKVFDTPLGGKE